MIMAEPKVVVSKRNKRKFVDEGYVFVFDKDSRDGSRTFCTLLSLVVHAVSQILLRIVLLVMWKKFCVSSICFWS